MLSIKSSQYSYFVILMLIEIKAIFSPIPKLEKIIIQTFLWNLYNVSWIFKAFFWNKLPTFRNTIVESSPLTYFFDDISYFSFLSSSTSFWDISTNRPQKHIAVRRGGFSSELQLYLVFCWNERNSSIWRKRIRA